MACSKPYTNLENTRVQKRGTRGTRKVSQSSASFCCCYCLFAFGIYYMCLSLWPAYINIYLVPALCHWRPEEDIRSFGTRVSSGVTHLCRCWEQDPGPLLIGSCSESLSCLPVVTNLERKLNSLKMIGGLERGIKDSFFFFFFPSLPFCGF